MSTETELNASAVEHQGVEPPRFETKGPIVFAGLEQRYTFDTMGRIPELWGQFGPSIGKVPTQVGMEAYGLSDSSFDGGNSFRYIAAVEVTEVSGLPDNFAARRIPSQKYAIFPHRGHVSTICETIDAIWNQWLPGSGCEPTYLPTFIEYYDKDFDPHNPVGHVEIWFPIKS